MQKICFIDSFKLALHVSGDSFAHLRDHFDCIYSFLEHCTDSAVCCRPVTQIGCNLCHRSAADSRVSKLFQKAVRTVKVLMKMGETVARNKYSKLKRINKTNFAASCWLLISLQRKLWVISHQNANQTYNGRINKKFKTQVFWNILACQLANSYRFWSITVPPYSEWGSQKCRHLPWNASSWDECTTLLQNFCNRLPVRKV